MNFTFACFSRKKSIDMHLKSDQTFKQFLCRFGAQTQQATKASTAFLHKSAAKPDAPIKRNNTNAPSRTHLIVQHEQAATYGWIHPSERMGTSIRADGCVNPSGWASQSVKPKRDGRRCKMNVDF
jgi:hypothetical protein